MLVVTEIHTQFATIFVVGNTQTCALTKDTQTEKQKKSRRTDRQIHRQDMTHLHSPHSNSLQSLAHNDSIVI